MTMINYLRNFGLSIVLIIALISSALALDPNVQDLVDYETRSNAVARRSNDQVQIEHYEIPLELVGQDIADRMDPNIKKALIFKKNGTDYVRWVINPEDTQWHLEVKDFLESKGLSSQKHTHLLGSMTASRSYIIEDPATGAQFSLKVSTNKTGGYWKNKKQPIKDAEEIRTIADFVYEQQQIRPFEHLITMDEPGIFKLEAIDQAMVIRTLDGLVGTDKIYLPGFSAVHGETGKKIARLNGSNDPEKYWRENYNKPLARALAELAARAGLSYDSPHSQNFLIELDSNLKPTGRIVVRDFGDSYLCEDIFKAKGRAEITANWTPKYIKRGTLKVSIGIMHGNTYPTWLSDEQYDVWGDEYFEEHKKEFSKQTGIPVARLDADYFLNNTYYSGKYKIQGRAWETFLENVKTEADEYRSNPRRLNCRFIIE